MRKVGKIHLNRMKKIAGIPFETAERLLKYLIEESECAIVDCNKMKETYQDNPELVHMYSIKMLHYEFMICRLKRHLKKTSTPKRWCETSEETTK